MPRQHLELKQSDWFYFSLRKREHTSNWDYPHITHQEPPLTHTLPSLPGHRHPRSILHQSHVIFPPPSPTEERGFTRD
ncbi:hypothetical protein CRENBAI_010671 [Crenichthys baileyi]|uniref:Uncharacterized protein n=1 Tax=Crenichthys baileyi TaxID=28760 RepID=A0AAV9S7E7_9TELE